MSVMNPNTFMQADSAFHAVTISFPLQRFLGGGYGICPALNYETLLALRGTKRRGSV